MAPVLNWGGGQTRKHIPMYEREIVFDPETFDFAMYLNGELIGFARTYQEAETTLDQIVYELLTGALIANETQKEVA